MLNFTFRNCRISVSFLFLAVAALLLWCDKSGIVVLTFIAAALHETGHFIMMQIFGVKLARIRVTPLGIDIEKSSCTERSYQRDALVSFSGPFANLIFAGIFAFFGEYFQLFAIINLALALFNLMPIEPLDGGQALYSLLCIHFSAERSAKAVSIVSFVVLLPLAVYGFLILFQTPWNFSLLAVCIYLMVLLVFKSGRYY